MDVKDFYIATGRELCTQIAEKAGTSIDYFSQIAYGHRRASVDLAHALVAAAEELVADPEKRLDLMSMLKPKKVA